MRKVMLLMALLLCAALVSSVFRSVQSGLFGRARLVVADVRDSWCVVPGEHSGAAVDDILFSDASQLLGAPVSTSSFSLSVADIDADLRDDILIGTHRGQPLLYLNRPAGFHNASALLAGLYGRHDAHAHTLADFDSDGDIDILVAGGGADGVGEGSANLLLVNHGEPGLPVYRRAALSPEVAQPAARTRTLMPVASANGEQIDIYLAALARQGYPNVMLRNEMDADGMRFVVDERSVFNGRLNDRGRGILADFDGDGEVDYLLVADSVASIFWGGDLQSKALALANRVSSAVAGDLNNDGLLDLFLARYSAPNNSDEVTEADDGVIFAVYAHDHGDVEELSFSSKSNRVALNLQQHVRLTDTGRPLGVNDIFLGPHREAPPARKFSIDRASVAGAPDETETAGTYVWYDADVERWHVLWVHGNGAPYLKGRIDASGIKDVVSAQLERKQPKRVRDLVLINDGNGGFRRLCTPFTEHRQMTAHAAMADFNMDGWLDVALLRRGPHGGANGDVLLLGNRAGHTFDVSRLPSRARDRLAAADLIAVGLFDQDTRPDLVITNGYGQMPGNDGVARLLLNNKAVGDNGVLVLLEGSPSNRQAIGARLTLRAANDALVGYRESGLNANISQDTYWVAFAPAQHPGPYKLLVEWPDRSRDEYVLPQAGRFTIKQGGHPVPIY